MGIVKRLKVGAAAALDQGHMWSDLFHKEACLHWQGISLIFITSNQGKKGCEV